MFSSGRGTMVAILLMLGASAMGCARSPKSATDAPVKDAHIATVRARQCGRCHAPPEPGEHTRASLESAFVRHRRRVRLTEDEWGEMAAYLAASPGSVPVPGR